MAKKAGTNVMVAERPQSVRGQLRRGMSIITPIDEIPTHGGGGAAYFLRPDGATIADILTVYPNGSQGEKKFSENSEYYISRQKAKGFEYVGSSLTPQAVKRIVEILASNREDEMLFLKEEIADADLALKNSDRPEVRDQQRRRKGQLTARLERVSAELDGDKLTAELEEIARAQRLAKVDPNILAVMREMVGDLNQKFITHFQKRLESGDGQTVLRTNDVFDQAMNAGRDSLEVKLQRAAQ